MTRVTKVLLLLAVVVPVTAYVAGSVASTGPQVPTDHSPVILRDARSPTAPSPTPTAPGTAPAPPGSGGDRQSRDDERDDGDEARVVVPRPTPVGEDDDDEWDDDGPDDDETDDGDD